MRLTGRNDALDMHPQARGSFSSNFYTAVIRICCTPRESYLVLVLKLIFYSLALIPFVVSIFRATPPATSPSKQERLLTSVVDALSSDPILALSSANARALMLRADARLECMPPKVDGAVEDSRRATVLDPAYGKAWRVLADAEEKAGNMEGAISAVRRWGEAEPDLIQKARREIERLRAQ